MWPGTPRGLPRVCHRPYLAKADVAYAKELGGKKAKDLVKPGIAIVAALQEGLKQVGIETFNKGRIAKLIMSDLAAKNLVDLGAETENKFSQVIEAVNAIMAKWRATREL